LQQTSADAVSSMYPMNNISDTAGGSSNITKFNYGFIQSKSTIIRAL